MYRAWRRCHRLCQYSTACQLTVPARLRSLRSTILLRPTRAARVGNPLHLMGAGLSCVLQLLPRRLMSLTCMGHLVCDTALWRELEPVRSLTGVSSVQVISSRVWKGSELSSMCRRPNRPAKAQHVLPRKLTSAFSQGLQAHSLPCISALD